MANSLYARKPEEVQGRIGMPIDGTGTRCSNAIWAGPLISPLLTSRKSLFTSRLHLFPLPSRNCPPRVHRRTASRPRATTANLPLQPTPPPSPPPPLPLHTPPPAHHPTPPH